MPAATISASEEDMETEVRFAATRQGARIAYSVEGAGPTVLIAPATLATEPLGVRQRWASCAAYSTKVEYDHAGGE